MLWEPFSSLKSPIRQILWGVLAVAAVAMQGPDFISSLRPSPYQGVDFFQDWASARNFFENLPIYTSHSETIPRYLGLNEVSVIIPYNAHPPASVLLFLPFAALSYPNAVAAWNVCSLLFLAASLLLLIHGLRIPVRLWAVFPAVTLILLCNPLRIDLVQGQFNSLLLFLLTAVWYLSINKKDLPAGLVLGIATAVKLFPGFLLLYFAVTQRWRAVAGAALSAVLMAGLAYTTFGQQAYADYMERVIPSVRGYTGSPSNVSLQGFWTKLFDPERGRDVPQQTPLLQSPALGKTMGLSCVIAVAAATGIRLFRCHRSGSLDRNHAYGLTLVAMLLVSPITWDHYLLLLMVPFAFLWLEVDERPWRQVLFLIAVALAMAPPYVSFVDKKATLAPLTTVTALSVQTYMLIGLWCWELSSSSRKTSDPIGEPST